MKGFIVALFTIGLVFANPNTAEAGKRKRSKKPSCKVSQSKAVSCKASKNIKRKILMGAAKKQCMVKFGKAKVKKLKPLKKVQFSSCKRGKCKKISAVCKLK